MEYEIKETLLSVKDINLSFKRDDGTQKVILRDINFDIKNIVRPGVTQGQVVSICGRSGIGKTQLFRILAGLNSPTSGTVMIADSDLVVPESGGVDQPVLRPVKLGDMGVIFQNYFVFPWRKVRKILLDSVAKNRKIAKADRVDAMMLYAREFDLVDLLDQYPQLLSGGQKQRVSIVQQLLNGGNFILFDEPFSGLDVLTIDTVTSVLQKISMSDEIKTLVIVSHDIPTSIALSDTAYIIAREDDKPGATIKRVIDLAERGLSWQENIRELPAFHEAIKEIKSIM